MPNFLGCSSYLDCARKGMACGEGVYCVCEYETLDCNFLELHAQGHGAGVFVDWGGRLCVYVCVCVFVHMGF
jgi:hypothetical protein